MKTANKRRSKVEVDWKSFEKESRKGQLSKEATLVVDVMCGEDQECKFGGRRGCYTHYNFTVWSQLLFDCDKIGPYLARNVHFFAFTVLKRVATSCYQ